MLGACLVVVGLFAAGIARLEERLADADHIVVGAFSRHTYEVVVPFGADGFIQLFRRFKVRRAWKGMIEAGDTLWFPAGPIRPARKGGIQTKGSHERSLPVVGQRYVLLLEDRAVGPYAGRVMINEKWMVRKNKVITEGGQARRPEEAPLVEIEMVARGSAMAPNSR